MASQPRADRWSRDERDSALVTLTESQCQRLLEFVNSTTIFPENIAVADRLDDGLALVLLGPDALLMRNNIHRNEDGVPIVMPEGSTSDD